jgi:hypothetical protein
VPLNIFEIAAMALHRCGYSVLPIMQGAKRPGTYRGFITEDGDGPWFGLKDWQEHCANPASEAKVAAWGRMADVQGGGLGVACGYGGLIAIDIDDDELVAPILDVLPEGFVGKVGRKGLTALVRAAEPMPSTPYDDANGHRLLDFLSTGRQTVLPPTRHPDTGDAYRWTTERTLLNTPLEDLPLFTDAHREAMEEVLRRYGWQAPEPTVARSRAVVERPVRVASEPRRTILMTLPRLVAVNGCRSSNLKTCGAFKAVGVRLHLFGPQETPVRMFAVLVSRSATMVRSWITADMVTITPRWLRSVAVSQPQKHTRGSVPSLACQMLHRLPCRAKGRSRLCLLRTSACRSSKPKRRPPRLLPPSSTRLSPHTLRGRMLGNWMQRRHAAPSFRRSLKVGVFALKWGSAKPMPPL